MIVNFNLTKLLTSTKPPINFYLGSSDEPGAGEANVIPIDMSIFVECSGNVYVESEVVPTEYDFLLESYATPIPLYPAIQKYFETQLLNSGSTHVSPVTFQSSDKKLLNREDDVNGKQEPEWKLPSARRPGFNNIYSEGTHSSSRIEEFYSEGKNVSVQNRVVGEEFIEVLKYENVKWKELLQIESKIENKFDVCVSEFRKTSTASSALKLTPADRKINWSKILEIRSRRKEKYVFGYSEKHHWNFGNDSPREIVGKKSECKRMHVTIKRKREKEFWGQTEGEIYCWHQYNPPDPENIEFNLKKAHEIIECGFKTITRRLS